MFLSIQHGILIYDFVYDHKVLFFPKCIVFEKRLEYSRIFLYFGNNVSLVIHNWEDIGPFEICWNYQQLFCFLFFLIPYRLSRVGVLVTKHILKDVFLLKFPPWTNGKELQKNQNENVVENFKTFLTIQSLPNSKLQTKCYAKKSLSSITPP